MKLQQQQQQQQQQNVYYYCYNKKFCYKFILNVRWNLMKFS
jgi:hypothetical protein